MTSERGLTAFTGVEYSSWPGTAVDVAKGAAVEEVTVVSVIKEGTLGGALLVTGLASGAVLVLSEMAPEGGTTRGLLASCSKVSKSSTTAPAGAGGVEWGGSSMIGGAEGMRCCVNFCCSEMGAGGGRCSWG